MKILENVHTQTDSKLLTDNDKVKIEQLKIAEDLSITTINVMGNQEYSFTSRSGIITVHIGTGTISNGREEVTCDLFNRIAVERNERITIKNTQAYPLTISMVTAN